MKPQLKLRPPKGVISAWTRVRHWIWFWVPWAALTLWLIASGNWLACRYGRRLRSLNPRTPVVL